LIHCIVSDALHVCDPGHVIQATECQGGHPES